MSDLKGRFGEQLVAAGLITTEKLTAALTVQRTEGGFLPDVLVAQGWVGEGPLLRFLAEQFGVRYTTADKVAKARPDGALLERIPVREAERLSAVPMAYEAETDTLTLLVADGSPKALAQIHAVCKAKNLIPVLGLSRVVRAAIQKFYYSDSYAFAAVLQSPAANVGVAPSGDVMMRVGTPALGLPAITAAVAAGVSFSPRSEDPGVAKLKEQIASQEREIHMLRVANELHSHLVRERNLSEVVHRVLAFAFDNLPAEDGVFLLRDDQGRLTPAAVRTRRGDESQVTVSETLLAEIQATKEGVLTGEAGTDPRFSGSNTVMMTGMRSMMGVPLIISDEVRGAIVLSSRGLGNAFTSLNLNILSAIAAQTSVAVENLLLTRRVSAETEVRARLSRFLSPALVELASHGAIDLSEAGELQEATILFADIRGFTSLTERLAAREVVSMLNEHFESMVEVVFSHGGILDKFVGDALMAIWGVPVRREDDAGRAVRAGLEMIARVKAMNEVRRAQGREPFEIGVGLDTGPVVFGAIGASRRLELTAVGDAVNTASRLCGSAAPGQLVVSENTVMAAGGGFEVRPLGPVKLKGKALETRAFVVLGELAP